MDWVLERERELKAAPLQPVVVIRDRHRRGLKKHVEILRRVCRNHAFSHKRTQDVGGFELHLLSEEAPFRINFNCFGSS